MKFNIKQLGPCSNALKWYASQKSTVSAWERCNRGDWMLWIAARIGVDDRILTRAKVICAKQVEGLMQDQRSKDALQAGMDYADGKIDKGQLNKYAAAADAAAYVAYTAYTAYVAYTAYTANAVAYAANYAANAAAYAAADAADYAADYAANAAAYAANYAANAAAYAAAASVVYAAAASAARIKSLKESADICRAVLTDAVFNIIRQVLKNKQGGVMKYNIFVQQPSVKDNG